MYSHKHGTIGEMLFWEISFGELTQCLHKCAMALMKLLHLDVVPVSVVSSKLMKYSGRVDILYKLFLAKEKEKVNKVKRRSNNTENNS